MAIFAKVDIRHMLSMVIMSGRKAIIDTSCVKIAFGPMVYNMIAALMRNQQAAAIRWALPIVWIRSACFILLSFLVFRLLLQAVILCCFPGFPR